MSLSFGDIKIPELHLPDNFNLQDFIALLGAKYDRFHTNVVHEFGPNGMYIIVLFTAFLSLILVIYIKSVIDTFHAGSEEDSEDERAERLFYIREEKRRQNSEVSPAVPERQRESSDDPRPRLTPKPDGSEEEAARALEEKQQQAQIQKEQELSRELVNSAKTDPSARLKETLKRQLSGSDDLLDWKKFNENGGVLEEAPEALHYHQQRQSLDELISLIINMLGRDVNEQKIAQALYYRTQGLHSEEDIIQMIRSVKDFIGLCNAGKFDTLPDRPNLPRNNEALYTWANGDNSLCLNLMEALLNEQIEQAEQKNALVKEMAYAQAANYACLMGNIASLSDLELAQSSYELAIELSPQNVNAWSRLADLHMSENHQEKAVHAYQTVLELGDEPIYAEQIANANNKLYLYYQQQGVRAKADAFRQAGQQFYQEYGIRTALTDSENEIFDLISDRRTDNLKNSIMKLLNNRQAAMA